ncbi:hypothetical protein JYK00_06540 [Thermosipho ferrireducens]|uniref:Uncharacterized protein n=1 Tax=Thermosipho ferrireducens TaxID=2571116 RepID=A0ABX7S4P1_9BACT|nr:hypothetical protein [Thermosipho ferrireducens]QTA37392.1 hypothetical protein JYK00_06540 [Thermosipho ferrireducens]
MAIILFSTLLFCGTSIFEFVENTAGARDFKFSADIVFDVYSPDNNELITKFTIDGTIINLEKFIIEFREPEFLKGIKISLDTINNLINYTYSDYTITEISNYDMEIVYEFINTAVGFLTSPIFQVHETKTGLTFIPSGYSFLKRLGLEPTKIDIYLKENKIEKITFTTEESTESVIILFKQFEIIRR